MCWKMACVFISLNFYIAYNLLSHTHESCTQAQNLVCINWATVRVCVCLCLNVDNWLDWHYLKKMHVCECMLFGCDIFGPSCPYFFSSNCGKEEKGGTGKSFLLYFFHTLHALTFCGYKNFSQIRP